MRKITLRIIAEETGLSKFAVSRALSGKDGVSDATRAHIQETADRLGYVPPVRATIRTVGVVFDEGDWANGEMNVQIQNGLQSEAHKLGYAIRAHWTTGGPNLAGFLDGCDAIFAVNIQNPTALGLIRAHKGPVIRAGELDPLEQVDSLCGTDQEVGIAAGQYLFEAGHREIVFVHGNADLRGRRERLYGLQRMVATKPDMRCHDVSWNDTTSFTRELDKIIAQGARPTAYFCGHDGLALTAYTDILARGWRIPRDVSVIGYGDYMAASQVSPGLTTFKIRAEERGRLALQQLDRRLQQPGPVTVPLRLEVPNLLIERGSVGPAPPTPPTPA